MFHRYVICRDVLDLRHNDVINGERSSRESKLGSVFRLVTVQRKEKDIINVTEKGERYYKC